MLSVSVVESFECEYGDDHFICMDCVCFVLCFVLCLVFAGGPFTSKKVVLSKALCHTSKQLIFFSCVRSLQSNQFFASTPDQFDLI